MHGVAEVCVKKKLGVFGLLTVFLGLAAVAGEPTSPPKSLEALISGKKVAVKLVPTTHGDGYVLESVSGAHANCVQVNLKCGDGTSASACCPSSKYTTSCPNARITCN